VTGCNTELAVRHVRAPGASLVAYQRMGVIGHVDSSDPQAPDKSGLHYARISARAKATRLGSGFVMMFYWALR